MGEESLFNITHSSTYFNFSAASSNAAINSADDSLVALAKLNQALSIRCYEVAHKIFKSSNVVI